MASGPELRHPEPPLDGRPLRAQSTGAFTGQLSLFGVPALLQFLCGARRTGLITFSSQQGDARIRLHNGLLHFATSPTHPSLFEFLVERGVVPREPGASGQGDVEQLGHLLENGIEVDKLAEALREALRSTIKEVVEWSDGWFLFDRVAAAASPPADLLFNAQAILLDAVRELDEERR